MDGQFLVRNHYLSIDPAQRGWISAGANYSDPVSVGDVMRSLGANSGGTKHGIFTQREGTLTACTSTFEEASGNLKRLIENRRREFRSQQYFVFNILTQSFFLPQSLFDDEIEQLVPGTRANNARRAGNSGS